MFEKHGTVTCSSSALPPVFDTRSMKEPLFTASSGINTDRSEVPT